VHLVLFFAGVNTQPHIRHIATFWWGWLFWVCWRNQNIAEVWDTKSISQFYPNSPNGRYHTVFELPICWVFVKCHVFKYPDLMCFPWHSTTRGPPGRKVISQLFRDLASSKYQQILYFRDWFAYKLILVGSGFKVHKGIVALNIGNHNRIFEPIFHPISLLFSEKVVPPWRVFG